MNGIQVNDRLRRARAWIFPPVCLLCGARGAAGLDLCAGCRADLPRQGGACARCALPLPAAGMCGLCQRRPPPFDRTHALFRYEPPLDHLIHRFKFHARLAAGRVLGEMLAEELAPRIEMRPELLIPVPLHPSRLRARGFNQALELARPLARRLDIPLDHRVCARTRPTPPQMGLSARARRRNMKDVFRVTRPLSAAHVALVDDVMTTGETVAALARCLRAAGAERVDVWVCARAVTGK